ncbi:MAG: hypothetical protein SOU50_06400, partial [Oscillospiraceae bacterium]|nr:hypothetical protein [Oscillospiraceae bacterium]
TFKEQNVNKISKSDKKTTRSNRYNVLPTKAFIERNPKAMDLINRNEFPVYDTDGKRWVKCRICGMIGISERFKTYKYASGVCDECIKAQKW